MIVGDKFIFINFPKSGSTFVREIIREIHNSPKRNLIHSLFSVRKPAITTLLLPNIRVHNKWYGEEDEHGTYSQIPDDLLIGRQVVSVIRDPIDRLISAYKYGYWKNSPAVDEDIIKMQYPNYPDLSFEQYWNYRNYYAKQLFFPGIQITKNIGINSLQLIQFFFKNPKEALKRIEDEPNYIENKMFTDDIADINFIHTENLNIELYEFLLRNGYSKKKISFIKNVSKINKSRDESETRRQFINDELLNSIYTSESLYYKCFPQYKNSIHA